MSFNKEHSCTKTSLINSKKTTLLRVILAQARIQTPKSFFQLNFIFHWLSVIKTILIKTYEALTKFVKYVFKIIVTILIMIINLIRPLLGPKNVCIYPISCSEYAKHNLKNKNFFIAIILITLRLLSCNPIGALFLKFKYRNFNKH